MPARLRLEPIGPEHAADLWRLHQDEAVAEWHGGPWSAEDANRNAAAMAGQWSTDGVGKWIASAPASWSAGGGLSRLGAAETVTRRIAAALPGSGWLRDRLEVGWTVRSALWGQATRPRSAGPGSRRPRRRPVRALPWRPAPAIGGARASPP